MNRVNLLSTDPSSSEVKMTATGQANHTGSTRTKAAKGLISHFMFLASLLLITLLTSGKAMAFTHSITLAANEGTCHISIEQTDEKTATLTASEGYTLPATLTGVNMNIETTLNPGEAGVEGNTYVYDSSTGVVTINVASITGDIVITATAIADASLSALTYTLAGGGPVSISNFVATTTSYNVADLAFTKEATVTLDGTASDGSSIGTHAAANIENQPNGTQTATATITVTSVGGGAPTTYTVNFTFKQDELTEVTAPVVSKFDAKMKDATTAVTALKGKGLTAAITTGSGATNEPLPVTWTYDKSKNSNADYVSTAGTSHKFTWTVTLPKTLANTATTPLTGEVSIANADASTANALTTLTYQLPSGDATNVKEDVGNDTGDQTYEVTLPFGTAVDAVVTVAAAASDYAAITVNDGAFSGSTTVTLDGGKGELVLTVTSESSAARTVTVKFTVAESELITKVEGIEDLELPQAVTSIEDVITWLEENVNATITSNGSSAFKVKWEYKKTSNGNAEFKPGSAETNVFDWKIVYANDDEDATGAPGVTVSGTITVTNHTTSTDATLSKLQYKIGDNSAVDITIGEQSPGTIAITVPALPFGTTAITLLATAKDPFAIVEQAASTPEAPNVPKTLEALEATPVSFPVEIGAGETEYKLKVTAEDGSTSKVFTLTFSVDKEKVTVVNVPEVYKLPNAVKTSADAIALLADMKDVVITTSGNTPMKLVWSYETAKNQNDQHLEGAFSADGGATNVFSWAVKTADGADMEADSEAKLTGTTTVTNLKIITGTGEKTVEISEGSPVDQIGDEESTTTIETVTVADAVTADQLTINNAAITTSLNLNGSVKEIVLKQATIAKVVLVDTKKTTLVLQEDNTIGEITNNGELTLNNATVSAASYRSMPVETKADALANSGAVKVIENNGTFTDNTATIVTVGGKADLRITTLPAGKLNATSDVTLAVVAESTKGDITYQWEKEGSNNTWTSAGTAANLTVKKADGNGSFRCKVVSTNKGENAKTTTLCTSPVSVTFKSAEDPSTPSDPTPSPTTYTVTLKKVAGATFSKDETTTVEKNDSFSFTITLDKDYDQSKPVVTVNGKAIEADTKGNYTIGNIREDIEIVVTGIVKNTATGTEDITADTTRAWSEGSTLHIHAQEAATAYIFTATGALQQQLQVAGDKTVQLRAGFYIVRIGTYTAKVIIR